MKIWGQSCGAFGKDPIWNDYEQALRKHAQEVVRPDTVVELHGVETIPGVDRYHASRSFCAMQSIRNAIRAEREGYDAFVMLSGNLGAQEIRELIDIPAVFMSENCIHFALMFAPKFGFLGHNTWVLSSMTESAKLLGLAERMVTGSSLNVDYSVWPDLYGKPERYIDSMTQKAKEIIARGAGIIVGSALPLSIWFVKQGLIEINGARILDNFGCALKMAELMVDLKKIGITRIKSGPPSKEVLEAIQKLYGV